MIETLEMAFYIKDHFYRVGKMVNIKKGGFMIQDNTFAAAVYEQNTRIEIIEALTREPDQADCEQWGISGEQWVGSLLVALRHKNKN